MKIEWSAPSDDMIENHQILLNGPPDLLQIKMPKNPETTQSKQLYDYEITDLIPGADYNLKLLVKYKSGIDFTWPNTNNQTVSSKLYCL